MRRLCSVLVLVAGCGGEPDSPDDMGVVDGGSSEGGSDESSDDESGAEPGIEGPIDGRDCPPDSTLTADNFGMPFVLTWCAGCHNADLTEEERAGAPLGIDLDTLDATQEHLLRVYARPADDNLGMPPAGGPSEEERAMLGDWLACGAPE